MQNNVETQYLNILKDMIETGEERVTRNGTTLSKFFKTISFDMKDGFPLLTTKKMFWKGVVEELLFFIRGDTDTTKLSEKGIRIWEPNTSREFLDKMNLNYNVGDMGPMYGYQWRYFNKMYNGNENTLDISSAKLTGIDQLEKVIEEIKSDPHSRRIMMTTFNPSQVNEGVLYPCHSIVIQFYVENNRLSCTMYQRSCDLFLGCPFNIASTSLLLHIISQLTNMEPGIVNIVFGDYHIYAEHIDMVKVQIGREPYKLCKLKMKDFKNLKEVETSSYEDYMLVDYIAHPAIKAHMIA